MLTFTTYASCSFLDLLKADLYFLQPTDMHQQKSSALELPEFNHEAS